MSDWTVDEINSTAADAPKAQQAEAKLGDWSSNDIEQATINPGETPKPTNVLEDVGKEFNKYVDYYKAKHQLGDADVARGMGGFDMITGGITYEDKGKDYSPDKLEQLKLQKINPVEATSSPLDPRKWIGEAVQTLPFMMKIMEGAAAGAIPAAGAAAGTAFLVGQAGPQVAVPEEFATIPIATVWGLGFGGRGGSFAASSRIMAGQVYLDLRDKGITHKTAQIAALASGAAMGAIETLQIGQLASLGKKAMQAQLAKPAVKATMMQAIKTYIKEVGVQVGEEELQEITQIITEGTVGVIEKNKGAIPTGKQIVERLVGTAVQSAQASAILVGGSKATGHVTGKLANALVGDKVGAQSAQAVMDIAQENAAVQASGTQIQGGVEVTVEPEAPPKKPRRKRTKPTERPAVTMAQSVAELKRQLKRAKPKDGGKVEYSRFSPESDTQEVLGLFDHYIHNQVEATEVAQADLELGNDVTDLSLKQEVAQMVVDIYRRSPQEVLDLAEFIEDIVDDGLSERLAEITDQRREREALKAEVLQAINGNKPVDENPTASEQRLANKYWQGKLNQASRSFGKSLFSWEGKLAIIFQDTKNPASVMRKLDVFKSVRNAENAKRKYFNVMTETVQKATGRKAKDVINAILDGGSKKNVVNTSYVDQNGKTQKLVLTRNEAIQLWNQMQDPTLHRGLQEGNGYTLEDQPDTTFSALKEELSDFEKDMAKGLRDFYKNYFPRLEKEFKAETGMELEQNPDYSGFAHRIGYKTDNANENFVAQLKELANRKFNQAKQAAKPGTVIARKDSPLALAPKDAFSNALEQIVQVEHWKAWRLPSKSLAAVFNDPKIKRAITEKFGKGMLDALDVHLTDMTVGIVQKQINWINFSNHILRKAGFAFLAGKPLQIVKQLTSVINFGLHMPVDRLVTGMIDFALHTKKAVKTLNQSEMFQGRYATFDKTFIGALGKEDASVLKKNFIKEVLMTPLRWGDKAAVYSAGWALYKHTLNENMKAVSKGEMSLEEAEKIALEHFERGFNTTQSSGTIDQLNNIARNPYLKVFTIFMQQPTRLAEFQVTAWRQFLNHGGADNLYKALRTSVLVHMSQAAFVAVDVAWILAWSKDDREKDNALWRFVNEFMLGPNFPLMGDMATALLATTENAAFGSKQKIFDFKLVPLDAMTNSVKLLKDVYKSIDDGEVSDEEMLRIALDYARSINLVVGGLPIEPPLKMIRQMFMEDDSLFNGALESGIVDGEKDDEQ